MPALSDLFCFALLFCFDVDSSPLADAPDEFDAPLALLPVVPELPAAPAAGDVVPVELDAPALPDALLAPVELLVPAVPAVEPLELPVADGEDDDEDDPLCASAIEDTDAINTKDKFRKVVLSVMGCS